MSRGVNKVILIGNLGADPDVRYTAQGEAVANLRLATSERWTDRQSGERKEHTEWHGVVLFRRLGEIAGEYLRKGARVYIEGKLRTRQWQDRDGQDRYTTEIVAQELQMLEARQRLDDGGRLDLPAPSAGAGRGNGQPPPPAQRNAQQLPPVDFDDDIPF